MMRSPAKLIVEEHRDNATASILHEVGESWLEVISIGELKCVPPERRSDKTYYYTLKLISEGQY